MEPFISALITAPIAALVSFATTHWSLRQTRRDRQLEAVSNFLATLNDERSKWAHFSTQRANQTDFRETNGGEYSDYWGPTNRTSNFQVSMTKNVYRALLLLDLQIVDKDTRKALDEVSTYLKKSQTQVENVRKSLDEANDYNAGGLEDSEPIFIPKECVDILQKSVISTEIENAVEELRNVARNKLA